MSRPPASTSPVATPLVLLPGWSVDAGAFARLVAPGAVVVSADFAGATSPSAFLSTARAAVASCAAPPVVLGWSLGALVALELASDPEIAVAALQLISATDRFTRDGPGDLPGWSARALAQMARAVGDDRDRVLEGFDAAMFCDDDRTVGAPARWAPARAVAGWSDDALGAGLAYLRDVRIDPARIRLPVSLLHGGSDRITPVVRVERLAAGLDDVTLTVFDGAGHAPFLSDPDGFAAWRAAATVTACA